MRFYTQSDVHITLHGSRRATQRVCVRASFHLHVIHDVCLSFRCLSLRVCPSPVSLRCLLLLFLILLVLCPALPLQWSTALREITAAPSQKEEYCHLAKNHPLTRKDREKRGANNSAKKHFSQRGKDITVSKRTSQKLESPLSGKDKKTAHRSPNSKDRSTSLFHRYHHTHPHPPPTPSIDKEGTSKSW